MPVYMVHVALPTAKGLREARYALEANDETEAWEKARAQWRLHGPSSFVKEIHETLPIFRGYSTT